MERFGADRTASLRPWLTVGLVLLCAALYLPGIASLPPTDRDEARFAQATRQMIETGDYVSIRFQAEPRHKKPVGIHWVQAACLKLAAPVAAEGSIWPYRIPSMVGATCAVWLLYFFLRSVVGDGAAALAGALLASSLLLTVEARLATTDALLLATVVAAQGSLMRRVLQPNDRPLGWSLLFWVAQGIGVLVKGPVTPLVSILTLLAWRLSGRRVRPLTLLHGWIGLPLALLIVVPWIIAVSRASGGAFLTEAIGGDLFPKLVSGQESHGFPPGYYLLLVTLTFWPGSLVAGFAVVDAWRQRSEVCSRFLLAWLLPAWVVFEIIPTKLPHYVLPLYPALAALTAMQAARWSTGWISAANLMPRPRSIVLGWAIWSGLTGLIAVSCVTMPVVFDGRFEAWSVLPALGALLSIAVGFWLVRRFDAVFACLVFLVLCSFLVVAPMGAVVLPRVEALWPSRAISRHVEELANAGEFADKPWAAVGYHEPSIVFALGTQTRLLGPVRAAEALAGGEVCGIIIEESHRAVFDGRANELGVLVESVGAFRGVNVSKGAWIELSVLVPVAAQAGDR